MTREGNEETLTGTAFCTAMATFGCQGRMRCAARIAKDKGAAIR